MMFKVSVAAILLAFLLSPSHVGAQIEHLVVGEGGLDWLEMADNMVGLDAAAVAGNLQPFEVNPETNLAVGELTETDQFTNFLGHVWIVATRPPEFPEENRPWVYGDRGRAQSIDGDIDRPTDVEEIYGYTWDLGLTLPINRVVFFPPEKGKATGSGSTGLVRGRGQGVEGQLIRDLFPRQYALSGSNEPSGFLVSAGRRDVMRDGSAELAHRLGFNVNNLERVADVRFETQALRYFRLFFAEFGFIAEVQFYGEGFLPQTHYTTRLIDMGEPVNFGRIHYDYEVLRSPGYGLEPVPAPDADVTVTVDARSGLDDTPLIHYILTDIGGLKEVTQDVFDKAPTGNFRGAFSTRPIPGQKGSIQEDTSNWSFWSAPHLGSGVDIQAPDGRQFVQLRTALTSEDVFAFARLKSITVEHSPLLANPVLGEVALLDEPNPADGIVQAPLGEPVTLTYDVRADFTSASQSGFTALRLRTPEAVELLRFQMGDPLQDVEPDSIDIDSSQLVVYFPSNPITSDSKPPIRLTFSTRVFNFQTPMEGEVFHIGSENLPQSINSGDASPLVSTNSLQVFGPLEKLKVLSSLELASPVVTPNGDGRNDLLELSFTLLGVEDADVLVDLYDLSGRRVTRLVDESRRQGRYTDNWDATVDGTTVPPGTYLLRVAVDTDEGTLEQTRILAVAY
ncbi:MAG TPA: hypothetical protein DIC52_16110 [Candidatus Latescibacteria bacterium]|nr:hypothetical protein [Candidatus Latescibacterota bacterium]